MNRTATAEAWLEGGLLLEYGSLSYRSRLVRGTRLREVVATTGLIRLSESDSLVNRSGIARMSD